MTIKLIPPNNSVKLSRLEEHYNVDTQTVSLNNLSTLTYYSFSQQWQTRKLPPEAVDQDGTLTVNSLTIQPGFIRLYEDYSSVYGQIRFERTGRKLQYNPLDGTGNIDIGTHDLSGTFTTTDGKTVTYTHGFITAVA